MSKCSQVMPRIFMPAMALVCVLAATAYAVSPDRITSAIDARKSFMLQNSVHTMAQQQYDQGAVDPSFKLSAITLLISPSPAQLKALEQLLEEQQDRNSAIYHKWLTPGEYADRFGLSQNDMNRVTTWLKSQGFTIRSIAVGRNSIAFSGTALQIQNTFKAQIHSYSVNGEEHFANATPLMIPAALVGVVTSVIGTHDFRWHPASRFRQAGALAGPNYYDTNLGANFLAPADVATIYDIASLYTQSPAIDGTGETIAVMGETDIFLADINDFRSPFGLSPISCNGKNPTTGVITACNDSHFRYVLIPGVSDPGVPDNLQNGDIGEADLDVEWSGAIAPGAQIVYVNSPGGNGVLDSLAYAVNAIPARVISLSYGECEAFAGSLETELAQAAAEGITIINSSGDSGAAGCDRLPPGGTGATLPYSAAQFGLAVGYPASSPNVTAVGGTGLSLANDSNATYWRTSDGTIGSVGYGGTANSYIPESAWNDDEELALYCDSPPSGDTFCSQGGPQAVSGWVALSSTTGPQQVQEDIWIGASGGGGSNCFQKSGGQCSAGLPLPKWQQKLSVPNAPAGVRLVPDVSFLASPNFPGYIYCTPQNPDASSPVYTSTCANGISGTNGAIEQNSLIGGTSVSAPLFAGILALLNQSLAGPSSPGLGNINPNLYRLASSTAGTSKPAFHQVTTGDNMSHCQPSKPSGAPVGVVCPNSGIFGFKATDADSATGYNLVAGLGSVDVANLAAAWSLGQNTTSISITASTTQANIGQSVTFTATLSSTTATGSVHFYVNNSTTAAFTFALTSTTGGIATWTTTSLPVGNDTVTASYSGDASNSASTTATAAAVSVNPGTFTLTSNLGESGGGTLSLIQGNTGILNMTVQSTNGFILATGGGNSQTALPVSYTCSGLPVETNCLISPNATNSSATPTVKVTTTPPTRASLYHERGSRVFYALLLPGLFGVVFVAGCSRRSLRSIRMLALTVMLGASTMWLGSCGGSNNSSFSNLGTPVGTYPVTINATTGGSSPVTASYKFILTVTNQ